MNRGVIDQLVIDLEVEGYRPGTPVFDAELRKRQVEACQEMQGVPGCDSCPAYDNCELVKAHLRDIRFGVEVQNEER